MSGKFLSIPRDFAETIRNVFLPRNPRKMRGAHPDVLAAVYQFIDAVENPRTITAIRFRPTHKHFEGGIYEVMDTALQVQTAANTWQPAVRYRDETGREFVRPASVFNDRFTSLN